ncbi:hypothetical protein HQ40_05045 [Porphyromonas gulae]|uniref:lipopolysaccharide biosynthesis protein n=1 Tax=Porphyromonas gulae TaxID=111105 RepID=UPI00052D4DC4|nr:oligosaccharide flippase family protein [Porphyromonas gulae]KGN76151.1 hypothetical protein HQ40_05045 [Porphyromonas gulae]
MRDRSSIFFKLFYNFFSNYTFRKIIRNFISLSLLQGISLLTPLVTLPILIKYLGIDLYGKIAYSLSIIGFFQSVVEYSFQMTGVRDIAQCRGNKELIALKCSCILGARFILLILSSLLIIFLLYHLVDYQVYILCLCILPYLWGIGLFPSFYFQGIERMETISTIQSSIKIISILLIFSFIKDSTGYLLYPLLLSGSSLLGLFISFYFLRKDVRLFIPKLSLILIEIKSNYKLFGVNILPMLYSTWPIILLGYLYPSNIIGVYDAVRKIAMLEISFISIIGKVFFPHFSSSGKGFDSFRKYISLISLVLFGLLIIFYKPLFGLLNIPITQETILLHTINTIGAYSIVFFVIYSSCYLLVRKKDRLVFQIVSISSIIGLSLSYPMVLFLGSYGAALTTICSQLIMGGASYFVYRNLSDK